MTEMKQISPAVFIPASDQVRFGHADLAQVVRAAETNSLGKARLLLHAHPDAMLHEMLIVHVAGQYIQPHVNARSPKSYAMVRGAMLLVLFDDDGRVVGKDVIGDMSLNLTFLRRFDRPIFHTILPLTETVAFVETILGPHRETVYAHWAPPAGTSGAAEYYGQLCATIDFETERRRFAAQGTDKT